MRKLFVSIAISGIFLVALTGVVGVVIYRYTKSDSQDNHITSNALGDETGNPVEQDNSPVEVDLPEALNDGYKKYSNRNFGVEFDYPDSSNVNLELMLNGIPQVEISPNGLHVASIIIRKQDSKGMNLKEWVEKNSFKSASQSITDSAFNVYEAKYIAAAGQYPLEYNTYYIKNNNWIYAVSVNKLALCANNSLKEMECTSSDTVYQDVLSSLVFTKPMYC